MDQINSFDDVWQQVMEMCGSGSAVLYNVWFSKMTDVIYRDGKVVLTVDSPFRRDVIMNQFADEINKNLLSVLGFTPQFEVVVKDKDDDKKEDDGGEDRSPISFKEKCTFDRFIIGPSNKFAYAAAYRVSQAPAREYNPLLIYGHSGLGKTHLVLAIQNEMLRRDPSTNVLYTTGEEFTNTFIRCVSEKNTNYFHDKYRNVDALIVDDIQFIEKAVQTQEEFFHTFNTLTESGRQVVLTSDKPPKEMKLLNERLRTRFESGLLADIQPPNIETRLAILASRAKDVGLKLPISVATILGEKLTGNIRQLEGAVVKLYAICSLQGTEPTKEDAQKVINDILRENVPTEVTVDNILKTVSEVYGVDIKDILSDRRQANITEARQVAMYLIRDITNLSQTQIGTIFGKNHSTVFHSLDLAAKRINTDPDFRSKVAEINKTIIGDY